MFISDLLKKIAVSRKGTKLAEKHLVMYSLRYTKIETSEGHI